MTGCQTIRTSKYQYFFRKKNCEKNGAFWEKCVGSTLFFLHKNYIHHTHLEPRGELWHAVFPRIKQDGRGQGEAVGGPPQLELHGVLARRLEEDGGEELHPGLHPELLPRLLALAGEASFGKG